MKYFIWNETTAWWARLQKSGFVCAGALKEAGERRKEVKSIYRRLMIESEEKEASSIYTIIYLYLPYNYLFTDTYSKRIVG